MKLAIIITGEYREFDVAHKSWSFLQWPNIDVYFVTWDKSLHLDKDPSILGFYRSITENDILEYIEVKDFKILPYDESPYTVSKSFWNAAMITMWKESIELLEKSNEKYDRVILLRPDIALKFDNALFFEHVKCLEEDDETLHMINSQSLGIPSLIKDITKMPDLLYLGTQNAICKLKRLSLDEFYKVSDCLKIDIHSFLADQFKSFYKKVYNVPIEDWCIVRSTSHKKFNKSFCQYKLDSKIWWESHHKGFYSDRKNLNNTQDVVDRMIFNTNSLNLYDKYDLIGHIEANKSLTHSELYPNINTQKKENHVTYNEDVLYNYNSYGFRVPDIGPKEYEEGYEYPTLLVSGCSNTEGVGLHEHHIWHSHLVRLLKDHFDKPIAKFNVGKGGRSTQAAIRNVYVSIEHKKCKPDMVILLLPPPNRQELFYLIEATDQWSIWNFIIHASHKNEAGDLKGLSKMFSTPAFIRKGYHELYGNLLFLKYYLQTKNIPWFFCFWQNDFCLTELPVNDKRFILDQITPGEDTDIEYPSELKEHLLGTCLPISEGIPQHYRDMYVENIAKDYTHVGPASHHYLAHQMYQELLNKDSFKSLLKNIGGKK